MKNLIIIIILLISADVVGQDTIYGYPYPNGIVTNLIESKKFSHRFSPINNPNLLIKMGVNETRKISYSNGDIYINQEYFPENYPVLKTDKTTGKFCYTGVQEFKNAKKIDLFNSLLGMYKGIIQYELISQDNVDFSFQKYIGCFLVKFAGDPYTACFNLNINFKDGKIKYEFSDFIATYLIQKTTGSYSSFFSTNNTSYYGSTKQNVKQLDLDVLYGRGGRTDDIEKLWIPLKNNIEKEIETIKRLCSKAIPDNKNDW